MPDQGQFDGQTFDAARDEDRLGTLLAKVRELMKDGRWRTLPEIAAKLGAKSESSISARLRDLRKDKFGAWRVDRRHREAGLWEYRLLPPLEPLVTHEPKPPAAGLFDGAKLAATSPYRTTED